MLTVPSPQLNENGCSGAAWQALEFATPLTVTVLPVIAGLNIVSRGGTSTVELVTLVVDVAPLSPFESVAVTSTRYVPVAV